MNLARRVRAYVVAHPWHTVLAVLTGALYGVAIGLPIAHGVFAPLGVMLVSGLFLAALLRLLVPAEHRPAVLRLLLLGVGARFALAALLYFNAQAFGRVALFASVPMYYVVGDDATYAELSWGVIQWILGRTDLRYNPPSWGGQAYLIGSFTYLEMLVFAIFGPILLNIQIANAALGGGLVLLVHDMTRRLFGARPALVSAAAAAILPSLVLWSSLGLKDALSHFLIALVLCLFVRFHERPRWGLVVAIFFALIPIETIRRYVYVGLVGLFPVAVALAPRLSLGRRARYGTGAAALAFFLLSLGSGAGQGTYGIPTGFGTFEAIRQGMGEGARTGFSEPRALQVKDGDIFTVTDAEFAQKVSEGNTPPATPEPECPQTIVVPAGGRVVLGTPGPRACPSPGSAVAPREVSVVRPGDIVIVGGPPATAAPLPVAVITAAPTARPTTGPTPTGPTPASPTPTLVAVATPPPLYLRPTLELANSVDLVVSNVTEEQLTMTRTLAYLPRGFAYALFAPFPWEARRAVDLLTIPEMLFWYLSLGALLWSLWRVRRAPWSVLPILLYVGGMLGIFVLTEGNFGTLYRHRDMVAPFAIALASPGLIALWDLLRRRLRRSPDTA